MPETTLNPMEGPAGSADTCEKKWRAWDIGNNEWHAAMLSQTHALRESA